MLSKIFQNLPRNIIYSANIWTFLNLTVLNKAVRKLYLSGKVKNPEDRIIRYLFNEGNHSKIDRTGMRFLWYFGTKLEFFNNCDRARVAMEYIDPVKAIFERKIACNDNITKAFVDAIIKGGNNSKLKNNDMRKIVPYHIQCLAGVIDFDAFEYDDLVNLFVREQTKILTRVQI